MITSIAPMTRDHGLIHILSKLCAAGYAIFDLSVKRKTIKFNIGFGDVIAWEAMNAEEEEGQGTSWYLSKPHGPAAVEERGVEMMDRLAHLFHDLVKETSAVQEQPSIPADQYASYGHAFLLAFQTLFATTPPHVSAKLRAFGLPRFQHLVRTFFVNGKTDPIQDPLVELLFPKIVELVIGRTITNVELLEYATERSEQLDADAETAHHHDRASLLSSREAEYAPAAAVTDTASNTASNELYLLMEKERSVAADGSEVLVYPYKVVNLKHTPDETHAVRNDAAMRARSFFGNFLRLHPQIHQRIEMVKGIEKLAGYVFDYFIVGTVKTESRLLAEMLQWLTGCFQGDFSEEKLAELMTNASGSYGQQLHSDSVAMALGCGVVYDRSKSEHTDPLTHLIPATTATTYEYAPAAMIGQPLEEAAVEHVEVPGAEPVVERAPRRELPMIAIAQINQAAIAAGTFYATVVNPVHGHEVGNDTAVARALYFCKMFIESRPYIADIFSQADPENTFESYVRVYFQEGRVENIPTRWMMRALALMMSCFQGAFSEDELEDAMIKNGDILVREWQEKQAAERRERDADRTGTSTERTTADIAKGAEKMLGLSTSDVVEHKLTSMIGTGTDIEETPAAKEMVPMPGPELSAEIFVEEAYEDRYAARLFSAESAYTRFTATDVEQKYRPLIVRLFAQAEPEVGSLLSALDYRLSGELLLKAYAREGRTPVISFPLGALFLQIVAGYLMEEVEAGDVLGLFMERRAALVAQYGDRMY